MAIEIKNIFKRFEFFPALNDVSLSINDREIVALLGPSGSGKTTLLRIIAGLTVPDSGSVLLNGEDFFALSMQNRRIGIVFQNYALFSHMTVFDNIAFGLRMKPKNERPGRREIARKVLKLLDLIQLPGLEKRYPAELSGGQKQRVALARALAIDPHVLLLDEPFGALDSQVRKDMRHWLLKLHRKLKFTSVFVTHDHEEALELADKVILMRDGKIEQIGSPQEIYDTPKNSFAYHFLGHSSKLKGTLEKDAVSFGGKVFRAVDAKGLDTSEVNVFIRPYDVLVRPEKTEKTFEGTVLFSSVTGKDMQLEISLSPTKETVLARTVRESADKTVLKLKEKDPVFFEIRHVRIFSEPADREILIELSSG